MNLPEVIETERLTLRPPRASDAGPMTLYAGDKRVAAMLESVPHPYPEGAAEQFIARCRSGQGAETAWVMDATKIEGAEFIGVISVKRTEAAPRLGYWVGPPFWRTGYASEAATAVVEAVERAGAQGVEARIFSSNEASAHVLLHAGLRETGAGEAFCVATERMEPLRLFELAFAPAAA